MKGICALASAAAFLAATVHAGGTVEWGLTRITRQTTPIKSQVLKRRDENSTEARVINDNSHGGYLINVTIGTPPQSVKLILDTGSSDLWVPASDSDICLNKTAGCENGSFDYKSSSSFVNGTNQFATEYGDGTTASGFYINDTLHLGEDTITNMTMGLGLNTSIPFGILGIGYPAAENAGLALIFNESYPNLPYKMQTEGLISTVAYSIALGTLESGQGSILFGAIDTERYTGELLSVPLIGDPEFGYSTFDVNLTSIHAVSSSGTDDLHHAKNESILRVTLDTGTTVSYLPADIAKAAWDEVGAEYFHAADAAVIPCSMANSTGYFSFQFGGASGPRINVTMDELVVADDNSTDTYDSGPNKGKAQCIFGIQNVTSDDSFLLGDTFLRSAYVVHDMVNNRVGLAAANNNATKSNIVPFPSMGDPIPSTSAIEALPPNPSKEPGPKKEELSAKTGFLEGTNSSDTSDKDSGVAAGHPFSHLGLYAIFAAMSLFSLL